MTDPSFPAWRDPEVYFPPDDDGDSLTINTDPEYYTPGTIMIGIWRYGEYDKIVLDEATALRFAKAIQNYFAGIQMSKLFQEHIAAKESK